MLNAPQIKKMTDKLQRFADSLDERLFIKVGELEHVEYAVVDRQYHALPGDVPFAEAVPGMKWSGEGSYCWFRGAFTPDESLAGKKLFVRPHICGYEAMLFVDGHAFGTFNTKIVYTGHGNHYCDLLKMNAEANKPIDVAIEYYAGHKYYGCHPGDKLQFNDFNFPYNGVDICVKDEEINDYYFDLLTVLSLYQGLEKGDSFRKGELASALYEVFCGAEMTLEDSSDEAVRAGIRRTAPILKRVLAEKNGDDSGEAGIVGHSHMDTAWLWHVGETVKKCARTYSNQLALMEEYPDYKFIQSSAAHGNFILKNYPELFERIKEKVKEGRYEPNGGVWVECDCNITSGESMIRQFLWGQRFTRKHFGYTSNCFWLPDTFGYSAAIPQIMKGCGVDYFLTTKISWNDTNRFPYDTFWWQGIDGTKVFTHFNTTHHFPEPADILDRTKSIKQKAVTDKRLLAFGYGDGGGGPMFEELEYAKRVGDLAGCPKARYTRVGDFMRELERDARHPNTYRGELYLELHRGTLTNQHTIKRHNRKSELALRDLEIATVSESLAHDAVAKEDAIAPLYETLLLNQFHDILPGTCINRAHVESRAQTGRVIEEAKRMTKDLLCEASPDRLTLTNTLSFERTDPVSVPFEGKYVRGDYPQQVYTDLDGKETLLLTGVLIPAFGSVTLELSDEAPAPAATDLKLQEDVLENGLIRLKFAENGAIASYYDKRVGRELVNGRPFNTFLMAEDLPGAWDNWDVDADIRCKFRDVSALVSREVLCEGPVAAIIRSKYQLSEKSTLTQDLFVFTGRAGVRFDTAMDWNDDHRFLKTAFDTSVYDDYARHEIQFGCVKRPTTRNNSLEEAKFEVVNHKYTDLSEPDYGVAMLNDCKYGITAEGGSLQLSLHKGGVHPDHLGDKDGIHRCVYTFLPHVGGFSARAVVRPAYALNVPALVYPGEKKLSPLVKLPDEAASVIVEAVKPCEDAERAYIVRLYEAQGSAVNTAVTFPEQTKRVFETNMLEETAADLGADRTVKLTFRPFEIKTLKVVY
ncbi:MAG: alpha-mannosidase [Clostridia bacterium]|nr:alpha-mannosidase [Clostridia bacterium]